MPRTLPTTTSHTTEARSVPSLAPFSTGLCIISICSRRTVSNTSSLPSRSLSLTALQCNARNDLPPWLQSVWQPYYMRYLPEAMRQQAWSQSASMPSVSTWPAMSDDVQCSVTVKLAYSTALLSICDYPCRSSTEAQAPPRQKGQGGSKKQQNKQAPASSSSDTSIRELRIQKVLASLYNAFQVA